MAGIEDVRNRRRPAPTSASRSRRARGRRGEPVDALGIAGLTCEPASLEDLFLAHYTTGLRSSTGEQQLSDR